MSAFELTEAELVDLLSTSEGSAEFNRFVSKLGVAPDIERLEERTIFRFLLRGVAVALERNRVAACSLVGSELGSFTPFSGSLPRGLSFADSLDLVVTKLGEPSEIHGNPEDSASVVRVRPSLRYDFATHSISILFAENRSRIEMLIVLASFVARISP